MAQTVIEKGTMSQTVELKEADSQRLSRIAQYRGISDEKALSEIIEEAEYDTLDEQTSDEGARAAFRSSEVQEMLAKVDNKLFSKK